MRTLGLVLIAVTGLGLSGCSQISSVFKKKPHYHMADGTTVYVDETLRSTPQQTYQFAEQSYDVDVYDGASQYAGRSVELYNTQPNYAPVTYTDPRDSGFVSLNGTSEATDWRNCETRHRGYLYISEYDFRLDPDFEVCMRNKGYVLTSESGPTSKQVLTAQTAGLRGVYQASTSSNTYSSNTYQPSSYQPSTYQPSASTTSAYPGYFQ